MDSVALQHTESQFPDQGLNLSSLRWRAESQSPGKSLLASFKGIMERGLKRLTEVLRLRLCHQGPATTLSSSCHFSWGERNPVLGVCWHQEQPLPHVKSQTPAEIEGVSWEREPSQSRTLDEPAGLYLSTPKNPL